MAPDPPARKLAARGQSSNGLDVHLEQVGELLRGEHVRLTGRHRAADDDVAAQMTLHELGHELAFRRLQLERGAVELLRRRPGQAHEQR
jgi:hypothetical protein